MRYRYRGVNSRKQGSGIRAALCTDSYMARMSREHNNANILALAAGS